MWCVCERAAEPCEPLFREPGKVVVAVATSSSFSFSVHSCYCRCCCCLCMSFFLPSSTNSIESTCSNMFKCVCRWTRETLRVWIRCVWILLYIGIFLSLCSAVFFILHFVSLFISVSFARHCTTVAVWCAMHYDRPKWGKNEWEKGLRAHQTLLGGAKHSLTVAAATTTVVVVVTLFGQRNDDDDVLQLWENSRTSPGCALHSRPADVRIDFMSGGPRRRQNKLMFWRVAIYVVGSWLGAGERISRSRQLESSSGVNVFRQFQSRMRSRCSAWPELKLQ